MRKWAVVDGKSKIQMSLIFVALSYKISTSLHFNKFTLMYKPYNLHVRYIIYTYI